MNYYLSHNYKATLSAGYKAKIDMEDLMQQWGFRNIGFKRTYYSNEIVSFIITLAGVLKACFCLKRGDILILQYPLKKYFSFICNIAHFKGAKVAILIHDLGSFRRKKLTPAKEIRRLEHSDYIIAANPSMMQWIREHGCSVPMGCQIIWDYLSGSRVKSSNASAEESLNFNTLPDSLSKKYCIVYAGALNRRKNSFLYEWGSIIRNYSVLLYGSGFSVADAAGAEKLDFKGFVLPDDLISNVRGDFGLVWDGNSLETCTGSFGEYLAYNNPHKTSLYLRCHLPVIIWSGAALAPFIQENKLGFCVDNLAQIDEKLATLSAYEYAEMKQNVETISLKIASGHFFKQAVDQAIATLA